MTFEEARAKLKKMSAGRYRALYYTLTEPDDQPMRVGCSLYVAPLKLGDDGIGTDSFDTWEKALAHMAVLLSKERKGTVDLTEAPE